MTDFDFDEESLCDLHKDFKVGDKITNEKIAASKKVPNLVSYSMVNLSDSNYGFNHPNFDEKDALYYLNRMKILSTKSISEIRDSDKNLDWHLHKTNGRNIIESVKEHFNVKKLNDMPEIYHFALYPRHKQTKADKSNKIKNPRIHFVIGYYGIIYPLFYDPYHEINPLSQ